jgi:hypothetical protein
MSEEKSDINQKGILKANWLHKIVNVEASVVTLFYDWKDKDGKDKDGKPWHARELDISQQITEVLKLFGPSKPTNRVVVVFVFSVGVVPGIVSFWFCFRYIKIRL